ncbi:Zn-dependent oxidoreductase, NADPH:quinone reductase [Metallosphaera yellowstonensis MK1]|uniref:Zn-dependent oxidoreductase, NADPH:quinone reductase n=1 Tax=Metallosphaera yellowstonensis MK1 TaxID=671065 RepID=H2C222_9CREN|nr:zinc-binding dehydrogenase [Metallosphaera yellowstonensis]EHP70293.1 Zn-dependent oxidoreductase, NADPH:quinone reductase [Metallosphaera yellowstonensis MK1]
MKAAFINKYGGPDVIEYGELPDPKVNSNDVLVRVKAASVNELDGVVRIGGYKQFVKKFPHILGIDFSGVVEKVGSNVKNISEGERVMGYPIIHDNSCEFCKSGMEHLCLSLAIVGREIDGSYAQLISVPSGNVIQTNLGYVQAAASQLSLLTAWHALTKRVQLKQGMKVFIWGGSGGVGTFAIQIAKLLGAEVITAAGEDWKVSKLKELGTDFVINYKEQDVVGEVMKYTGGKGCDLVFDSIAPGGTLSTSVRMVKKGGTMIVLGTGVKESDLISINLRIFYVNYITMHGTLAGSKKDLLEATRLIRDGKIKPVVDSVMKLEEVREAHRKLDEGKKFGKIILDTS